MSSERPSSLKGVIGRTRPGGTRNSGSRPAFAALTCRGTVSTPVIRSSLGCTPVALTAVGSIAFDSVRTPFGERDRMLGGSAVHFALAARFFTDVRVVGPVGDDFGDEEIRVLSDRGVDTEDIERIEGGETFFWRGHYEYD